MLTLWSCLSHHTSSILQKSSWPRDFIVLQCQNCSLCFFLSDLAHVHIHLFRWSCTEVKKGCWIWLFSISLKYSTQHASCSPAVSSILPFLSLMGTSEFLLAPQSSQMILYSIHLWFLSAVSCASSHFSSNQGFLSFLHLCFTCLSRLWCLATAASCSYVVLAWSHLFLTTFLYSMIVVSHIQHSFWVPILFLMVSAAVACTVFLNKAIVPQCLEHLTVLGICYWGWSGIALLLIGLSSFPLHMAGLDFRWLEPTSVPQNVITSFSADFHLLLTHM